MILLSDRDDHSQSIYDAIVAIEPCTRLRLDGALPHPGNHAILVCDVDLSANLEAARATLQRCALALTMPILYLSRRDGDTAAASKIRATAVLPSRASKAQILFTIRRLIEASSNGTNTPFRPSCDASTAAQVRDAGLAFGTIVDASARGRPLAMEVLAKGGDALIAAVGGGRIAAWLDTVQAYDDQLYRHCLLVGGLATAFAIHLGVSPAGQRLIAQSALVHDLGKLGIPHSILSKPSSLSGEELQIVRRHPAIGHAMLVGQGGFDPRQLDIVLHHHEFLDGSGYPEGLRSEAISPLVRLMTICDICAALIERRTYKPAMSPADAVETLRGMKGKLDGSMVEAFASFMRSSVA